MVRTLCSVHSRTNVLIHHSFITVSLTVTSIAYCQFRTAGFLIQICHILLENTLFVNPHRGNGGATSGPLLVEVDTIAQSILIGLI